MGTSYRIIKRADADLFLHEGSDRFEVEIRGKNGNLSLGEPGLTTKELGEMIFRLGYVFGIWATEEELRAFESQFRDLLYKGSPFTPTVIVGGPE